MLIFKNDSQRLIDEFFELKTKNRALYDILQDLAAYTDHYFKKLVVITMIYRTEEEQDQLYKGKIKKGKRYEDKKWKSPHQFWHSADLRSSVFTKEEIDKIVEFLNYNYNKTNAYAWTAECHDIGAGMHFHIQYSKKG